MCLAFFASYLEAKFSNDAAKITHFFQSCSHGCKKIKKKFFGLQERELGSDFFFDEAKYRPCMAGAPPSPFWRGVRG
jgi:hypothetical protein